MVHSSKQRIVEALLERHGRTYAEELGLDLARNTPSVLFRWLCAAILLSARISADAAMSAARALTEEGWTTAEKLAQSTWEQRARTLNEAGYARYDERTATMLGDSAQMALEKYGGDLRHMREQAGRDPAALRRLLKEFKGLGEVGVDIFFREAQSAWDELYPFAGRRDLEVAAAVGLEGDPAKLAKHVSRHDFPRLTAALVRAGIARDLEEVLEQARSG